MGTKYSTILVGGDVPDYNANPPTDDGSQTEANRVKYSTITSDLTAPLHTGIVQMDGKLVAHTNEGPDTEAGNVTLTTADHNKVLECSGTITVSLPNPSGNTGFQCTVKNAGAGVITVDVDGGANIDGAASITLAAGAANKVYVNNAGTAYFSVTGAGIGDGFASGVIIASFVGVAPTGWTKKTDASYNNIALRVSTGTVTDIAHGTVDFDTVFGLTATDSHTLIEAEIPQHDHGGGTHTHNINYSTVAGSVRFTLGAISGGAFAGSPSGYVTNNTATVIDNYGGASPAHAHDIDLQVRYRDVIAAEKD